MPESKTSSRRILARERQAQALELRKQGATFQVIAQKLHYATPDSAQKAITSALNRITAPVAAEVKKLDLERLEGLLWALEWKIKLGDVPAIIAAVRILDRRAKLLGLDAPVVVEGTMEHIDKRDLTKVPQEDLDRVLAEVNGILHGVTS